MTSGTKATAQGVGYSTATLTIIFKYEYDTHPKYPHEKKDYITRWLAGAGLLAW